MLLCISEARHKRGNLVERIIIKILHFPIQGLSQLRIINIYFGSIFRQKLRTELPRHKNRSLKIAIMRNETYLSKSAIGIFFCYKRKRKNWNKVVVRMFCSANSFPAIKQERKLKNRKNLFLLIHRVELEPSSMPILQPG